MLACAADYAEKPQDVCPLLVGAQVPRDIALRTEHGASTTLREAMADQPTVLVFFRGGWCPYCDLQLSELRLIERNLQSIGYQIIAISPDAPAALRARSEKNELGYRLLSDSGSGLIKAFGIAFKVSDEAVARFNALTRGSSAGAAPPVLPVPAVYIVDRAGRVQFQYVNPDYRVRLSKDLVLAAAQAFAPTNR